MESVLLLVNNRPDFSSEQIVSLCTAPDAPEDLKEISAVIETVLNHISSIKAYSLINTGTPIYRCVNYMDLGYMPKGFSYLPASFIGTAPAKFAGSGRFNEAHDMMFYGASNPRIAAIEVGERSGFPYTIGTFYVNKRIRVLNLCNIWDWMCPSIFEPESEELRESWFFLRQFIKLIIEPSDGLSDAEKEKLYRPTQVMTKYLRRLGGLYGIEYRSSKSIRNKTYGTAIDRCYVLFAENNDCLDELKISEKLDKNSLQLFMSKSEQFISLP